MYLMLNLKINSLTRVMSKEKEDKYDYYQKYYQCYLNQNGLNGRIEGPMPHLGKQNNVTI